VYEGFEAGFADKAVLDQAGMVFLSDDRNALYQAYSYTLDTSNSTDVAWRDGWEAQFLELFKYAEIHGVKVFPKVSTSVDIELTELVVGDLKLFVIAMIVILCYFVCAISRRSWVRHRLWVGAAFGGLMLFSTTATFGLLSVFGMDLNFLCVLVPFLVVGVSVDTGILYVNSLEFLGNDGTLALKKVGPSVLGATLTSVMSFAIGTITDVPGIRVFCICAAVMFVVTFLATIISLPIVLTWDNDRISRKQGCCCTCFPKMQTLLLYRPDLWGLTSMLKL